jgi:hypothetical protein
MLLWHYSDINRIKIIMSEALKGPEESGNGETSTDYAAMYKEAHPDAVEDVKKAEVMGYAGKDDEEKVVAERAKALDAASKVGQYNGYDSFEGQARKAAGEAKKSRVDADKKEGFAADIYDQTSNL